MLRVVAETLQHRGTQGWLVGGTVRDRELGRFSPDLDVVVADDPKPVAAQVAARLRRPWFALSKHFDAYRVLGEGGHIDIAALRGGGLGGRLWQAQVHQRGDSASFLARRAQLHEQRLIARLLALQLGEPPP